MKTATTPVLLFKQIPLLILLFFGPVAFAQRKLTYQDKQFSFVLLLDSTSEACSVKSITITGRKQQQKTQVLVPEETKLSCTYPKDQIFIIEDMNFDGYKDIRLLQFLPAAPNLPYYCWTYAPKSKTFVRQKALEEITSPEFSPKEKRIFSSWRDGCCHRGATTYKYSNGKPIVIAEADIKEENGQQILIQKKRVNGALKTVKKSVEKARDE